MTLVTQISNNDDAKLLDWLDTLNFCADLTRKNDTSF
jgi:hypothetical protein